MKISSLVDVKKLSEFVRRRLNTDGGYTFACKLYGFEFPSSISETYYALATLSIIGEKIPNKEKTIQYLQGVLAGSGCRKCPSVAFYASNSLVLLSKKPDATKELIRGMMEAVKRSGNAEAHYSRWFSADYDTGDSCFRTAFYAAKALGAFGVRVALEDIGWVLEKMREGGFGAPDIASTYHALSILSCAGYEIRKLRETKNLIESCAVPEGGYAYVPSGSPPFVESTYFAIASLTMLGEKPSQTHAHLKYLSGLQNKDGGFRRAAEIGISNLANCYFGVKAMHLLLSNF